MIDRRRLVLGLAAAPLAGALLGGRSARADAARGETAGWRRFEIVTRVEPAAGTTHLWLPVAQSFGDYQSAGTPAWTPGDGRAELVRDAASGAAMLHVRLDGATRAIEMRQQVATRDRQGGAGGAAGREDLASALEASPSLPTHGIVRETAQRIVGGRTEPVEKARAIYDWVVENTRRDTSVRGCGEGDVLRMLESGDLGGKCADISALFVALARSAGLPAREVYGIRVADSAQFRSIGRSGDVTKAQHCRAEVHLDGEGWLPVDPADVRKVVLEDGRPLGDPAVAAFRDRSFGAWEMNWLAYNGARDVSLPGGERQAFFMYPAAMGPAGMLDCLEPSTFAYSIAARELAA